MSIASEVAAQLKADTPSLIVHSYPVSAPANIPTGKAFVNVYRESFTVADNNGHITHNLKVIVAVPQKDSAAAENLLDAAVDSVMLTLEAFNDIYWQDATRIVLGDSWPAYEINLTAQRPQVYKSALLTNS